MGREGIGLSWDKPPGDMVASGQAAAKLSAASLETSLGLATSPSLNGEGSKLCVALKNQLDFLLRVRCVFLQRTI